MFKLTGCREGKFTCSDGQCIRGQTLMYKTLPFNISKGRGPVDTQTHNRRKKQTSIFVLIAIYR